eukprot:g17777.t1
MNQVQEKIDIVAEENVSKFVLTDNVVAQLQEKVKHVSEELIQSHMNLSTDQLTRELQETVQRRLSTQAVIEELRKELHWRKASSGKTSSGNAGSYRVDSLLTSEFSREDSQGGQFLREDSQIQGSQGSELQITQSSQSGELLERIEILELQVQRATEDHKGLEDDIFNRLKDLELQVQRGVENTSYLEEDFADRCKEIDAQVHLAATSQRDLAEDVFQRIEDLEDQVRRKGERQEQMDLHLRDLQDMVESRSERRPAEDHLNCLLPIVLQSLNRAYVLSFRQCTLIPEKILIVVVSPKAHPASGTATGSAIARPPPRPFSASSLGSRVSQE